MICWIRSATLAARGFDMPSVYRSVYFAFSPEHEYLLKDHQFPPYFVHMSDTLEVCTFS